MQRRLLRRIAYLRRNRCSGLLVALGAFTFASMFSVLQLIRANPFHVAVPLGPDGRLSWADMMYFSFTVLTLTGFGGITPATGLARSLIVVEQVLGVMYVAFLIARLANLYGARPHRR